MDKGWVLVFSIMFLLIALAFGAMFHQVKSNKQIRHACEEAGGIPIFGDRDHFKVCLSSDAILEYQNEYISISTNMCGVFVTRAKLNIMSVS